MSRDDKVTVAMLLGLVLLDAVVWLVASRGR